MSFLCPFCGDSIPAKNACPRESCSEARARIPTAEVSSRGVPRTRSDRYYSQPEPKRLRKAHNIRLLPGAWEDIRRASSAAGVTMSELVERWALSLRGE